MLTLFWRTIHDRKWSFIIYTLVTILFVWMYVAILPSIIDKAEEFRQLLQAYPESMMKALGVEQSALIFDNIENFLAMEHYSLVLPILLIAMFVAWGGAMIAGEIEKGTIETLLAQPLSRRKIFFSKYLSGLFALVVFILVTTYAVIPLCKLYDLDYNLTSYHYINILSILLGLAIYSISIFFSALFSEKGKVYFISAGILVLMYVLKIISSLKENLADLKYGSFFYYFDYNKALMNHQIDNLTIVVFLGVIVLFTSLAVLWFSKRDIAV